jgi:hypothetical protein
LGDGELADELGRRGPLLQACPALLGQLPEVLDDGDGQPQRGEHHEVEGLF